MAIGWPRFSVIANTKTCSIADPSRGEGAGIMRSSLASLLPIGRRRLTKWIMKRICDHCSEAFYSNRPKQRLCGYKCRALEYHFNNRAKRIAYVKKRRDAGYSVWANIRTSNDAARIQRIGASASMGRRAHPTEDPDQVCPLRTGDARNPALALASRRKTRCGRL